MASDPTTIAESGDGRPAAGNTCEHGWTWGQCCPKPWPSADRTAFTHGMELLDGPAVLAAMTPRPADEVVIDEERCPGCELHRDVTTYTCARCGQLYDPSLHHVCLDGSTARSILSSALTGTRPYDQAGRAIKKLADHGYSIVPTPCRHSTYHHGCPSCDRQDPEVSP